MSTATISTARVTLGVLRSKISYYCIFLIKDFDEKVRGRYGLENSKNMRFVVDKKFIRHFLDFISRERDSRFNGVPIETSKNRLDALYEEISNNILHEYDDL